MHISRTVSESLNICGFQNKQRKQQIFIHMRWIQMKRKALET